jgi:hypothetical protein
MHQRRNIFKQIIYHEVNGEMIHIHKLKFKQTIAYVKN